MLSICVRTLGRVGRRFLRERRGSALAELALTLAFLGTPLLLGTADVASVAYQSIEVSNAAHAGAVYGMTSASMASNSAGIITAAQTEASDIGTGLSVTPTIYYACSANQGGTQYTSESAAATACSGNGNHPLEFLEVAASAAVTPPIRLPVLPSSFNLSSTSVMEVEE